MKTSKLLIHNVDVGNLSRAESDSLAEKRLKHFKKKLNLPKHVRLVVNKYSAGINGNLRAFETIEL